jgi:hypothetical protein
LATRAQTRYFVIGLYIGSAAVVGALLAVSVVLHDLGVPPSTQLGLALAGALAMVALRAFRPHSLPQNGRQVPAWVTETHPAGFMVFGAEMGTGMRTFSPTVLPHVLAFSVLAVTVTQPLTAVAAAVGFATGRALMIPLYRAQTRDGGAYRFAVPLALELAVALAAVGFVAWWHW